MQQTFCCGDPSPIQDACWPSAAGTGEKRLHAPHPDRICGAQLPDVRQRDLRNCSAEHNRARIQRLGREVPGLRPQVEGDEKRLFEAWARGHGTKLCSGFGYDFREVVSSRQRDITGVVSEDTRAIPRPYSHYKLQLH